MPDLRSTLSGSCGEYLTWTMDALGTLTVTGEGDMWNYDTEYNRPPWSWECSRRRVREVILRPGVNGIGSCAFYESGSCVHNTESPFSDGEDPTYPNHYLSKVILPDSLTRIGFQAFRRCMRLLRLDFPGGLTEIGDWAFSDCASLTHITLPESLTTIGRFAFYKCESLTALKLPDSLIKLDDNAFAMCTRLKQVSLPDHIPPEIIKAALKSTPWWQLHNS